MLTYGYCWICDTMLVTREPIGTDEPPNWIKRPDLALADYPQSIMAFCSTCNPRESDKVFVDAGV